MADRPVPSVRLYQNPWSATLPDGVLLQILTTAATNAEQELQRLIAAGEVEEGRGSYGCVILDPTRPRWQLTADARAMAAVLLGPDAERYLPNALGKADAHDRHQCPNGILVDQANFTLGDGDFAWGESAGIDVEEEDGDFAYSLAIAGGSGLSAQQDHDFAKDILVHVMDAVTAARRQWLKERRQEPGDRRWWNGDDQAPEEYLQILELPYATADV